MTTEQKQAYEWAKSQSYQSVAARYAKELCGVIDDLQAENAEKGKEIERLQAERDKLLDRAHEAQVERDCARAERGAAVEDMRGICYLCKHAEPYKFGGKMMMTCGFMRDAGVRAKNKCPDCPTFEWRGAQGEG